MLSPMRWAFSKFVESYIKKKLRLESLEWYQNIASFQEISACLLSTLLKKFYDKVEQGSIILRKASSFSFCKDGVLINGEAKPLKTDLVIFATRFCGDKKLRDIFVSSTFRDNITGSPNASVPFIGVSYHFERETDDLLGGIYEYRSSKKHVEIDEDLYPVALFFGYVGNKAIKFQVANVNKFKDNKGNFKESLVHDIRGMLCLYEASHLSVHGEDILDEALKFCTTKLESMVANDLIPSDLCHTNFNILQKQHQMEICHLSKWWKDLDVAENLPFARDRVVELYFWGLGGCFEPQYSLARKIFTKVSCIVSVIDDAYDAYGTYEELELFTSAVERGGAVQGRKTVQRLLCKEAEYMSNALVSVYCLLTTVTFAGMGEIASKEAFDWLFKHPKILKGAQPYAGLWMTLYPMSLEQKREHVASIIECYMKQHGVSKQEAIDEFQKQIVSSWKNINKELILRPTQVPMPLLVLVLNLTRVMDLLYKDKDAYTNVGGVLIEGITLLLVDPVPI
ncbi:(-)-germacrene D synthase [Morella rubra]|uniref:(-)-germacrene D synthase n=1 Tax=Morella rubra TaxID=262757 RepID=A0A6A1VTG8_9ROSI|nr:(-)-germacrene D synthase [Morella rubra]